MRGTAETFADGIPPEVAPVRPGEDLPWDRVQAHLSRELDVAGPMDVLQFPNGSANLTYLVSFGEQRFVLRRPPFGVIAPGAHDMKREHRVLSRLWRSYDRAPRAYLLCEDHAVAGSDFLVSQYRPGTVVWAQVPPELEAPDAGRRLGLAVVDALADLHAVDPAACDLQGLGRPDGFLERQLAGWRKRWDLVETDDHAAVMNRAAEALARSLPTSTATGILHNDFKMDNCQFTPGDPDRVSSVFDWDMATVADPLVDLGTLLGYWPDPSDTPDDRAFAVQGTETMGLPTRAEVLERYAATSTADLSAIAWYEAFAGWRVGVILQQLYVRWLRGDSSDERMASRGQDVGMLATRALRILADA